MTSSTEVIAHRNRHRCNLPGRKERKRQQIAIGSVVRCICEQLWIWDYGYEGRMWKPVKESDLK